MQSQTHIELYSGFRSQETGNDTFASSHAKLQQFFPLKISLSRVALFFGESSKRLSVGHLGFKHRRFYKVKSPSDSFHTHSQTSDRMAGFS